MKQIANESLYSLNLEILGAMNLFRLLSERKETQDLSLKKSKGKYIIAYKYKFRVS